MPCLRSANCQIIQQAVLSAGYDDPFRVDFVLRILSLAGVVIIRCPGCRNLHLIADKQGRFGDGTNVEQLLTERGESVATVRDPDLLDLSPSDIDLLPEKYFREVKRERCSAGASTDSDDRERGSS